MSRQKSTPVAKGGDQSCLRLVQAPTSTHQHPQIAGQVRATFSKSCNCSKTSAIKATRPRTFCERQLNWPPEARTSREAAKSRSPRCTRSKMTIRMQMLSACSRRQDGLKRHGEGVRLRKCSPSAIPIVLGPSQGRLGSFSGASAGSTWGTFGVDVRSTLHRPGVMVGSGWMLWSRHTPGTLVEDQTKRCTTQHSAN